MNTGYLFFIFLIPLIGIAKSENEVENIEDPGTGQRELRDWPWGRKRDKLFFCPSLFGTFADIFDCSAFYICVGGIPNRKKCNRKLLFDKNVKLCLPFLIATCDKGDDDGTTARPTTKSGGGDTTKDNKFSCPSILGNFEHPSDCSKYYSCTFYVSSLKSCSSGELFDTDKKKCKKAKDVKCGKRKRPDEATTEEITTTPIFTETPTPTEPEITPSEPETTPSEPETTPSEPETTTPTPTEPETTTPTEPETTPTEPETTPTEPETTTPTPTEPETTTPTEPETTTPTEPETTTPTEPETTTIPTTEEPTTTKRPKVTAPDTECDEDDVDCIIDDLGETPDWFVCPEDIGSYPHPSSKKLFIFCINWKPSVKKCGQDLVFSEDLMTCVHPYM